jgi:hypothetical protein
MSTLVLAVADTLVASSSQGSVLNYLAPHITEKIFHILGNDFFCFLLCLFLFLLSLLVLGHAIPPVVLTFLSRNEKLNNVAEECQWKG